MLKEFKVFGKKLPILISQSESSSVQTQQHGGNI